jgi:hypothetical protein
MDFGASHNVIPKVFMEEIGIEISKSYQDLYSFDSKKVKCFGLIKALVVSLSQLPLKSVVMDIFVVDMPPKFGMILSKSLAKKVGASLHMDLTYATILVFRGEHRILYGELRLAYIMSDHQNLGNHPIYVVEDEVGSSIFHINDYVLEISVNKCINQPEVGQGNEFWKMSFDGSYSKEGSSVGIISISPSKEVFSLSYKYEFETTNNIAKYEALVLGLRDAKDMAIDKLEVFGDSKLVVNQAKDIDQTKQLRIK